MTESQSDSGRGGQKIMNWLTLSTYLIFSWHKYYYCYHYDYHYNYITIIYF